MSVHPKFDEEHSNCGNCAAFVGSMDGPHPGGSCHRFAPSPTREVAHFDAAGEGTGSSEQQGSADWPWIDDAEMFCLDWFPRKVVAEVADESRWDEFFASLSRRAMSGLERRVIYTIDPPRWEDTPVQSFAALDALIAANELRYLTGVGPATSAEIRAKRQAFPGGPR